MKVSNCMGRSRKLATPIALLSMLIIMLTQATKLTDGQLQPVANGGTTLTLNDNGGQTTPTSANQVEMNSGNQEEQVVAGLLQWLWNKKREKDAKKRDPIIMPYPVQPQPLPLPLPQPIPQPHLVPVPVPHHQPKTIHIHITNHIKKDHKKNQHKKHGHYEHYHDGHYDLNDKFYSGKFHAPLLSHHYSFDHFDLGGHYGDDHYGGSDHYGGHDYHAGHESRQEPQFVAGNQSEVAPTTTTTSRPAARHRG